jgi:hypothetical protein
MLWGLPFLDIFDEDLSAELVLSLICRWVCGAVLDALNAKEFSIPAVIDRVKTPRVDGAEI